MMQPSRSRQKQTSGSKPKGSRVDFDFLPTLFFDDVEDTRNSVGLVHPLVWESLFENTHNRLKPSSRKTTLATPRKSSKNVGTNHDEETPKHGPTLCEPRSTKNLSSNVRKKVMPDDFLTSEDKELPKYKAASNRNKSTNNVVLNVRQKIIKEDSLTSNDEEWQKYGAPSNRNKDMKNVLSNVRRKNINEEFLNEQQPPFSTKNTSKCNSGTVSNDSKLRKGKTESQTTRNHEKDAVAKTTLNAKGNEVLPTRKLRSSHKDTKPVHGSRSVNDFSIENMDWYYENEDYYIKKYYDILSDHAIPEKGRTKSNAANAYTYLLLDSRQCKKRRNISWLDFIYAIFYIGKGTGDRAFQHAKDTEKWLIEKKAGTGKKDKKFQKIEEIWVSRNTIKVFKVTESITDNEAFTREAAMIDAMGLRRLCNKVSGHYGLGRAVMLRAIERCELGATLLIEAWDIFRGKEANVTDVKPRKKEIVDLYFVDRTNCNSDSDDEDVLCYGYY